MAQITYDPDSDERFAPQHLHEAEEAATQDAYDRKFDDIAKNYEDTTEHPLGAQEAAAGGGKATSTASGDTDGMKYSGGGAQQKKSLRGRFRAMSRGRKAVLVAMAGGGGGLIAIIVLLFLLASSLKIPNLMQNITTYEFARVTRQYAESADRVTTEKLAADTLDDATWKQALQDKYQTLRDNTWGKFDSYRPSQVMKNLQSDHNFQITYQRTPLGREQLKAVTLGDRSILYPQRSAVQRFTPVLSSVLEFKDKVNLAQNVSTELHVALDAGLRGNDIGPIVRGSVARSIRKELGISLVAWTLGKYQGKDAKQARLEEARQKAAAIDEKAPPADAVAAPISDGENAAAQTAEEELASDTKLQAVIDNGGVSNGVKSAVAKAIETSGLQDVIGVVNPVYGVAMPLCIVYDGSLDHSGPTINNQTRQQMAAYSYLASASDQQRAGSQSTDATQSTELASAIGATNSDLGDISNTNAMKRSSGESIDTSGMVSAEASAGGEYTLLNVLLGSNAIADTINSVADSACPALTNIWGGIGLGVLNIGIAIFTGGSSEAAEEAAGTAATQVLKVEAKSLADRLVSNLVGKTVTKATKLKNLLYDTGKDAAKIAAATVIAKLIVNARAGQINGGFTQGTDLANEADSGGNIMAGMVSQQQLYGRPLSQSEVAQSDQQDIKTIAQMNSSKSLYERYLATDNAQSLLDRVAMSVGGSLNSSIFRSLINIASTLFHPTTYFGAFATSFSSAAHAAPSDQHYGNVQFGWSEDEEKLIDNTESYRVHLENQAILDQSGKEDEIASTYKDCFTKQIGDLLSSGEIVRDGDGNVLPDQGLCAPNNLGPNNSKYGDLVFRYRLAMSYGTTIDQLTDDQQITTASADSSAPSGIGSYQNPLRGIKNLTPERIDGGVDYNGSDGPIYAVGDGKVVGVRTSGSGWPGLGTGSSGAYIMYQLTDGPAQGKYVYMAEDCTPTVKAGDTLTSDTVICNYHYQGTAMEMGWSNGSYGYATDDYTSHGEGSYASNTGQDFSKFLVALGAPAGSVQGTKSSVPMPAGWPSW